MGTAEEADQVGKVGVTELQIYARLHCNEDTA